MVVIDPRPDRDRRDGRLPPARAAGHRRVLPRGAVRRRSSRRNCSTASSLTEHTTGWEAVVAELGRVSVSDYAARCGVDEDLIRGGRAAHRGRAERCRVRGPRRAAGPEQRAVLVPREAALADHAATSPSPARCTCTRGCSSLARQRDHRRAPSPGDRRPGDRRAHPLQLDPRGDPHRSPEALPGDDRRELATRRTRSPTRRACARRCDALDTLVVIDVAHDRDGAASRLRAAGGQPVREVGGDVLQPRVPAQRLPPARPLLDAAAGHAARARDPRAPGARARRDRATRHWSRCARPRGRAARSSPPRSARDRGERPAALRLCGVRALPRRSARTLPDGAACRRRAVGRSPTAAA